MSNFRSFFRLALAGAAIFAGVTSVSIIPSGASPQAKASLHSGRVLFPTVAAAHAAHAAHAARTLQSTGSTVLSAHGGLDGIEVTIGTPKVYVVFYGSQWGTEGTNSAGYATFSGDTAGLAPRVQALLAGVGTNNELWSGVMTQYCDGVASGTTVCPTGATHVGYPTGGALAGVWYDNSVASPTQATGYQLAAEAVAAAGHFGNTTSTSNRSAQYVIVSPTGTHPDGFNTSSGGFCAYHDYNGDTSLSGGAAPSSYGDIAFTNFPYVTDMGTSCGANYVNAGSAGALDGVSIVEGHEYAETLTDQNAGYGWWDSANGYENGDLCAWVGTGGTGGAQNVAFATGSFAMQGTWSNAANGCAISGPIISGQTTGNDFSLSASPSSGSVVQGTSVTTTVNTATVSGSSQTVALSVAGLPTGASATFSPSSVTSGSSSTLTISTTSTASTGSFPLVITGSTASGSHTTGYTLQVTAVSAFSLTATPATVNVSLGQRASTTISMTTLSGTAQTASLSVSGLPRGVKASFSPASVNPSATSTLTLSVSSHSKAGKYTLTVKGTGTLSSASTTVVLSD